MFSSPFHLYGPKLQTCGHSIHLHCFQSYHASLLKRHLDRQSYEGIGLIDLEDTEILCPNCRKISNCLLPILRLNWQDPATSDALSLESLSTFVSSLIFPPKSSFEPNRQILDSIEVASKKLISKTIGGDDYFLGSLLEQFTEKHQIFSLWKTLQYSIWRIEMINRTAKFEDLYVFDYAAMNKNSFLSVMCRLLITSATYLAKKNVAEMVPVLKGFFKRIFLTEEKEVMEWTPTLQTDPFVLFSDVFLALIALEPLENGPKWTSSRLDTLCTDLAHYVVGLKLAQIEHCQKSLPKEEILPKIDEEILLLPLLRQIFIFKTVLFGSAMPIFDFETSETEFLLEKLKISMKKVKEFHVTKFPEIASSSLTGIRRHLWPPFSLQLPPLPQNYEELLAKLPQQRCLSCKTAPKSAAFCLLCGRLLCISSCCKVEGWKFPEQNSSSVTETVNHLHECCAGKGEIFLARDCVVFLVKSINGNTVCGNFNASIYFDKYGEEDIGFKRGKALFLSQEKLQWMLKTWLTDDFEQQAAHNGKYYII